MVAYAYQPISLVDTVTQTGVAPATAGGDNTVPPNDRGALLMENSNASTRTVTILVPAGLDKYGKTFPDLTYTLGATTGRLRLGNLPQELASPADGLIHFTVSADTGVTIIAASL